MKNNRVSFDLDEYLKSNSELESIFRGIPENIKKKIIYKKYEKGEEILKKDEEVKKVLILCNGVIDVINEFENGKVYSFSKNKAVDFIGEIALLAGEKTASVTVRANVFCETLVLRTEDFLEWTKVDPGLSFWICRNLSSKIYHRAKKKGDRFFSTAMKIVIAFLLDETKEKIKKTGSGKILKTRAQMVDELAISIRTLNRVIKELKEKDFITIERGKITLFEEQYKDLKKKII